MPIAKIAPFIRGDEMTDIQVNSIDSTLERVLELAKNEIKRLKAENAQLRAELASIKQKNAKLEQRIETLNNELESRVSYYNTSGKWGEY